MSKEPSNNIVTRSMQIALSVDYAVVTPNNRADAPPPLLLALHGWGQTCERFARWVAPLADRGFFVVAPQAPHQLYVNYDPKTVGFNWLTMYEKERSITEFVTYMHKLIDTLHADYDFDASKVSLIGFSQGVSMSYRFAVRGGLPVGAVIACGSDLPPDVAAELPNREAFPVLIVHGKDDPMINIEKAESALAALREHHFHADTHFFEGGHQLPREVVAHIGDWLAAKVLAREGAHA